MEKCPVCDSVEVNGLVEAFWVPMTQDSDWEGQWCDYESSTEISGKRYCRQCEHEYEI